MKDLTGIDIHDLYREDQLKILLLERIAKSLEQIAKELNYINEQDFYSKLKK